MSSSSAESKAAVGGASRGRNSVRAGLSSVFTFFIPETFIFSRTTKIPILAQFPSRAPRRTNAREWQDRCSYTNLTCSALKIEGARCRALALASTEPFQRSVGRAVRMIKNQKATFCGTSFAQKSLCRRRTPSQNTIATPMRSGCDIYVTRRIQSAWTCVSTGSKFPIVFTVSRCPTA